MVTLNSFSIQYGSDDFGAYGGLPPSFSVSGTDVEVNVQGPNTTAITWNVTSKVQRLF